MGFSMCDVTGTSRPLCAGPGAAAPRWWLPPSSGWATSTRLWTHSSTRTSTGISGQPLGKPWRRRRAHVAAGLALRFATAVASAAWQAPYGCGPAAPAAAPGDAPSATPRRTALVSTRISSLTPAFSTCRVGLMPPIKTPCTINTKHLDPSNQESIKSKCAFEKSIKWTC